jgi:V/A-type H+-transporting ATPase subunit E
MESKINELTEKLRIEGVERGQIEAEKIINQAKNQAAKIIEEAQSQAESIRVQAQKDAIILDKNTKSELKMFCDQAVNALKTEVANIVSDKIVKQTVDGIVDDKHFMREFMLKVAEKWGANEDIVISTTDAQDLKAFFAKKAKDLLDKGVKIEQINGIDTLFCIQPSDGAYKVNFGKDEFENYFKAFLRPQLVNMLF